MTTDSTTHWTDGAGPIDGQVDYGPPPLPAAWKPGEECHTALIDPPGYVFITVHDSNGGSSVHQYTSQAPGMMPADVSALVAGHDGVLTLTWNIGTGVSAPFVYHCAPSTTTTTTIEPATSTTTVAAASTTTSFAIEPTTTTTVVGVPPHLPDTGFGNADLGIGAFGALGVGALAIIGARFWKAHR